MGAGPFLLCRMRFGFEIGFENGYLACARAQALEVLVGTLAFHQQRLA